MQNDNDNAVGAASNKAGSEADQYMAALNKRAAELQATGLSRWVAFGVAELEARVARWPETWGDDLQVLIYGDFDAPDHTISTTRRSALLLKLANMRTRSSQPLCAS